ncbi:MAG: hypothetical protein JO038_05325 [Alphaproteobacteria bacterium]|nr:hypothetical protein [Alphaproteobacteria bacterium]
MPLQQVVQVLQAAIEASVYVAPAQPGLTVSELCEVGKRVGLKDGEIGDALPRVATLYFGGGDGRLSLPEPLWHMPGYLIFMEEPDLRNPAAFDFVVAQLNELVREVGAGRARLARSIMLDRTQARSIPRHDVEVAISLMLLSGQLAEDDGALRFKVAQCGERQLPSASRNQPGASQIRHPKAARTRVMPHVKDVIERRTDGRPISAEPLAAFTERLEELGYGHFRLWWSQTVAELGRTDPASSPLSALVLAAALVEGALTFVVKHAQTLGLAVFGSSDFTRDPRTWKIDDLVASAARGSEAAILDSQTKNRADGLVHTRQRIHAGRMLSEFPKGVPDLRPEEARDAKAVAEQVVRRVLDWLERYPAR